MSLIALQFQDNGFDYRYALKFYTGAIPKITFGEFEEIANESLKKRGLGGFMIPTEERVFYGAEDIDENMFDEEGWAEYVELLESIVYEVANQRPMPTNPKFSHPTLVRLGTQFFEFISESRQAFAENY